MKDFLRGDSIIVGSILFVLALAPVLRGGVDPASLCLIAAVILTSLFLFVIRQTLKENLEIRWSGLEAPLLLLFLLGFVSSFSSLYPAQSHRELGFFFLCLSVFFLVQNLFTDRKRVYLFSLVIIAVGICLSVFGLFKYAVTMGADSWQGKLSSTYVNRNHFAGLLELCLPLSIGLTGYFADKDRGKRGLLIYGILLMAAALVLSLSRGAWLGAGLSLLVMTVLAKKKGLLSKKMWVASVAVPVIILVSVLGLNLVLERFSSFGQVLQDPVGFENRIRVWKGTTEIIRDNPLLGTGLGTFAYTFPPHRPPGMFCSYNYAHNDFLHFSSEMGLLFLPLFFWLVFSASRMGINVFFNTKSVLKRGVALGCVAGILAIFVHSVFDFNLQIPANALLFFSYLGIIGALKKNYEQPI